MDNACFGVTNHFKDRNNEGLFLTYRYVPLKLFAKPSRNSCGDYSFRLFENEEISFKMFVFLILK